MPEAGFIALSLIPKMFAQVQPPRQSEVDIVFILGALVVSQALDIIHVLLIVHVCIVSVMTIQVHTVKTL